MHTKEKVKIIVLLFMLFSAIAFSCKSYYKIFTSNNYSIDMDEYLSYALAGTTQLILSNNSEHIKILSCYPEKDKIILVLEGNIPIDVHSEDIESLFYIVDDYNNKARLQITGIFCDETLKPPQYQWIISCEAQVKGRPTKFNLNYKNYKIPIILTNIKSNSKHRNAFNISESGNVKVAAITRYVDTLLEVTLISDIRSNIASIDCFKKDIVLSDKNGNIYYALDSNTYNVNTFYFDAKLSDELELDISSINVSYNDAENSHTSIMLKGNWHMLLR